MRYIRTKDGIIDMNKYVIFWESELNHERVKYILKSKKHRKNGQDYTNLLKEAFIKEADTIDGLCDAFIGMWKNDFVRNEHDYYYYSKKRKIFYNGFEELTYKEAFDKFDIFYGAILTNKGLIFVAKINEEGKLELI